MEVLRLLKRRPWGIAGAVILLILVLIAVLAPVIAPYYYNEISIANRMQPPGSDYFLGADNLGRDIFSRLLFGARPYVEAGLVATGTAVVIGVLLGFMSRFFGRKTDSVLRITLFSLSVVAGLIVLASLISILLRFLPFPINFTNIFMSIQHTLDTTLLTEYFAVFTGLILSLIFLPVIYSLARKNLASRDSEKSLVTLLSYVLVYLGIAVGAAVILITPAGFLGFGVPPPLPEWGNMLSGSGRQYMLEAPWTVQVPAVSIGIAVLGLVLFGLALWEIWAPHLKERAYTD